MYCEQKRNVHIDGSCKTVMAPFFTTVSKSTGYVRAPIINLSYNNVKESEVSTRMGRDIIPKNINERYNSERGCVVYKNVVAPNPMPVLATTAQSRMPSEYQRRKFLDFGEASKTGYKQYPFGRIRRPTPGSVCNTQEFEVISYDD